MTSTTASNVAGRIPIGRKLIIIGIFLTGLTVGTDFVSMGALMSSIQSHFGISLSTTQWVVNAYALTFAMAIVSAGRLADILGQKRLLVTGLLIFAAGTILTTAAPDFGLLITGRVVQGLGAAVMWPTAMGYLFGLVPGEKIGIYLGGVLAMCGLGNAIGPLVAGAVAGIGTEGWRLFFAFNLVTVVPAVVFILRGEKQVVTGGPKPKIDYTGMAVLTVTVFALFFALDLSTTLGWGSPQVIIALVVFAVGALTFPAMMKRSDNPLIAPAMWRNRKFVRAASLNGLQIPACFILFVFVPQIGVNTLGYSDFQSALLLMPTMVMFAVFTPIAGNLYDKFGPRATMAPGYLATTVGAALIAAAATTSHPLWTLIPAGLLIGAGATTTVGASGALAMQTVDEEHASLASAVAFQVHLLAGAAAVTITAMLISAHGSTSTGVQDMALFNGVKTGMWVAAGSALLGTFLALFVSKKQDLAPTDTKEEVEAAEAAPVG